MMTQEQSRYVIAKDGRFFIRMGFANFNSRANNRDGYKTAEKAISEIRRLDPAMRNHLEESPNFSR